MTEENHDYDGSVAPSETGPSLDDWKPDTSVTGDENDQDDEVKPSNGIDWAEFEKMSTKEKQAALGVPVTGSWGRQSKDALKEARGE